MRRPVARIAALLAALALAGLSGCASLREGVVRLTEPIRSADTAAAADAAASAAAPARARPLPYDLVIEAPAELRTLLTRYLDISRLPATAGDTEILPSEVARLAAAAPAQARTLLETEGYFAAEVSATRVPATPSSRARVTLVVVPGPRTRVSKLTVQTEGPLNVAEAAGDPAAQDTTRRLTAAVGLKPGDPFTQSAWADAKLRGITDVRAHGYPLAGWSGTAAQVDPAAQSAKLFLVADSGPLYRLGEVRVQGLKVHSEQIVHNLQTFTPGTPYSETLLSDFQERLQKAGLFERAVVELDTSDPATADAAVVNVRLRELPLQQATAGVGISANTGPRVTLEHTHRQPFGWAATATNDIELGRDLRRWTSDLVSHPLEGNYRNLLGTNVERLATNDEVVSSWRIRAGRTRDTGRIERLYFVEVQSAKTDNAGVHSDGKAASVNYNWVLRNVDNVLLPTRGLTATAETAAGYAFSTSAANGLFGRGRVRAVGYLPFGAWFTQARLEFGELYSAANVGVPDTLLFRAGGDDSVRGYGYRSLGPTVDGVLSSGHVLFTSSLEVARPIVASLPSVWGAFFIDAGNAAEHWNQISPKLGTGVGVRWRSPVGPLRVDLAYGEAVHRFRLHLSVGIAL